MQFINCLTLVYSYYFNKETAVEHLVLSLLIGTAIPFSMDRFLCYFCQCIIALEIPSTSLFRNKRRIRRIELQSHIQENKEEILVPLIDYNKSSLLFIRRKYYSSLADYNWEWQFHSKMKCHVAVPTYNVGYAAVCLFDYLFVCL